MKKIFIIAAAMICGLVSCEKVDVSDLVGDGDDTTSEIGGENAKTKKFTFTMKGDFSDQWKAVTRGYLSADGKDLIDVWVLDYMGDVLVQQIHQVDNTAEDFGKPVMQLAYGEHHIYFVASRGTGAVLDTDAGTITFARVLDTFYKDYEVNVASTSNGNRAVTLDRVATKLRLTFTDFLPADAAVVKVSPHTWYYGLNYKTGAPCGAQTDAVTSVSIPESQRGKTGVQVSLFGFSPSAEWTTDITISSEKEDNTVLGSATLTAAPFKSNRMSDYQGPLFGSSGTMTLSLDSDWDTYYEGTW